MYESTCLCASVMQIELNDKDQDDDDDNTGPKAVHITPENERQRVQHITLE